MFKPVQKCRQIRRTWKLLHMDSASCNLAKKYSIFADTSMTNTLYHQPPLSKTNQFFYGLFMKITKKKDHFAEEGLRQLFQLIQSFVSGQMNDFGKLLSILELLCRHDLIEFPLEEFLAGIEFHIQGYSDEKTKESFQLLALNLFEWSLSPSKAKFDILLSSEHQELEAMGYLLISLNTFLGHANEAEDLNISTIRKQLQSSIDIYPTASAYILRALVSCSSKQTGLSYDVRQAIKHCQKYAIECPVLLHLSALSKWIEDQDFNGFYQDLGDCFRLLNDSSWHWEKATLQDSLANAAIACYHNSYYVSSREYCQRYIKMDKDNVQIIDVCAMISKDYGNLRDALTFLNITVQLDPLVKGEPNLTQGRRFYDRARICMNLKCPVDGIKTDLTLAIRAGYLRAYKERAEWYLGEKCIQDCRGDIAHCIASGLFHEHVWLELLQNLSLIQHQVLSEYEESKKKYNYKVFLEKIQLLIETETIEHQNVSKFQELGVLAINHGSYDELIRLFSIFFHVEIPLHDFGRIFAFLNKQLLEYDRDPGNRQRKKDLAILLWWINYRCFLKDPKSSCCKTLEETIEILRNWECHFQRGYLSSVYLLMSRKYDESFFNLENSFHLLDSDTQNAELKVVYILLGEDVLFRRGLTFEIKEMTTKMYVNEARMYFQSALEIESHCPKALYYRSILHFLCGRIVSAMEDLTDAIHQNPILSHRKKRFLLSKRALLHLQTRNIIEYRADKVHSHLLERVDVTEALLEVDSFKTNLDKLSLEEKRMKLFNDFLDPFPDSPWEFVFSRQELPLSCRELKSYWTQETLHEEINALRNRQPPPH